MVELVARPAWEGPEIAVGSVVARPLRWAGLHSLAPFRSEPIFGIVPEQGRVVETGAGRLIWIGLGQWLLEGAAPELGDNAAVTDQSDAWCGIRLTGAGAVEVLARLVPVDLDPLSLPAGSVARTMFGHMQGVLIALPDGFDILVPRSFTATALHDLETAMRAVAAREML